MAFGIVNSLPRTGPARTMRGAVDAIPAPLLLAGVAVIGLTWGTLFHVSGLVADAPTAFLAVALAAALASIGGFAFGPICGAMLLPLADTPVGAVQIMLACSVANQALSVWSLRRAIDWRGLLPFLAGGVFGVPVGVHLLLTADATVYPRLLGSVVVLYAVWMLAGRQARLRDRGPLADAVVGMLGGITGGLSAFPSGPVTAWCGLRGWDKTRQRGVYQPYILAMQVLALGSMAAMGRGSAAMPGLGVLLYVPVSLVGTACGLALFRRLTDRQFGRAVNILLLLAGVAMLVG